MAYADCRKLQPFRYTRRTQEVASGRRQAGWARAVRIPSTSTSASVPLLSQATHGLDTRNTRQRHQYWRTQRVRPYMENGGIALADGTRT